MAAGLNSGNFSTVWSEDFTQKSSLNSGRFPIRWGQGSEYSFGGNGLTLTSNGHAAGFLTSDHGAGDSYGYGLYSATFTMPTHQANGAYICLWPANDKFPGPEIDLIEQYNGKPYSTVHWEGGNGGNAYHANFFNVDVSKPTTVAVNWQAGSLTYYVNGQQVVQYTQGGAVPIPKDHAHGGVNESFGIGNTGPAGTKMTVSKMSFAVQNGGGAPAPTPPSPNPPSPTPPHSTIGPITISNPGMHFVSNPSGGANVPITLSDPGLKEVHAFVMNSHNVAEENWITIPLNSAGKGTYDFHFQHTGDYVVAVSDPATSAHKGVSSSIVISHS